MPDGHDWPAIADHGLIGDLRTCALVGIDRSTMPVVLTTTSAVSWARSRSLA
jgi:hypothetical protein